MFVVIEGADAGGKATQSKLLADKMGAKLLSFPDYETPMGKLILGHLKKYFSVVPGSDAPLDVFPTGDAVKHVDAMVFQALQLSNRMEHAVEMDRVIKQGKNLVCDRYWQSGVVYGGADGLNLDYMLHLHEYLPHPDLSILLDIDAADSVVRRPERRDRYEKQAGLMDEVSSRYRALWHRMVRMEGSLHWVVVDGRQPLEAVTEDILKAVSALEWK